MPDKTEDSQLPSLDLDEFRVSDRNEILRVLRDLAKGGQLITAYFNEEREFLLTTILQVDPQAGHLVLDFGPDAAISQHLLDSGEAHFITHHNQVRVYFRGEGIVKGIFEGEPVFVVPMPDSIVRVQRREYYRLNTPMGEPLFCHFRSADGEPVRARVLDISVGGVGLVEPEGTTGFTWEPGDSIEDVVIELPEEGAIHTSMEIRNRFELGTSDHHYRVGCMFGRLQPRQSAAIQRYIHKVELERRRILRG